MLVKTGDAAQRAGIVGYVCVRPVPPLTPPPLQTIPQPPRPGAPPQAPPAEPYILQQYTYRDEEGDCWLVIEWGGISGTFSKVTKTPTTC